MSFKNAQERARQDCAEVAEDLSRTLDVDLAGDTPAARVVVQDILEFVQRASRSKALNYDDPEQGFEGALAMLGDAAKRDFMLRNVLEAMKRGEEPHSTLSRYQQLGLMTTREVPPPLTPAELQEVASFQSSTARAAQYAGRLLNRMVATLTGVCVEAAKEIPKLANLKMSVTFVAGVPCPSFAFEAGAASWDAGDFWTRVSGAYKKAGKPHEW